MIEIGRYLLVVISLAGMILSDDPFSPEKRKKFLDHILYLHNNMRLELNKSEILRTESMDLVAYNILTNKLINNKETIDKKFRANYFQMVIKDDTDLSNTHADFIFSNWCRNYIVPNDPRSGKIAAAKQILWTETRKIGLAFERTDKNYAVAAVYIPRYESKKQRNLAPNDSNLLTLD